MTVQEALEKFSDACVVEKAGEIFVRIGNWEPITRSLRHFTGERTANIEEVGELNGDTVLGVDPAEPPDPPKGKSKLHRPPFYLVVK